MPARRHAGTLVLPPLLRHDNSMEMNVGILRQLSSIESNCSMMPSSPSMRQIVADMYDDLDSLVEVLHEASRAHNEHCDLLDRAAQRKEAQLLDLLGVLHAQTGHTDKAIKRHPTAIAKSGKQFIEAMHNLAYLLHRQESDDLAVRYYTGFLSTNPSFGHCWLP